MINNTINSLQKSYMVALYVHKMVLKQISFHSDSIIFREVLCCPWCNTECLIDCDSGAWEFRFAFDMAQSTGKIKTFFSDSQ